MEVCAQLWLTAQNLQMGFQYCASAKVFICNKSALVLLHTLILERLVEEQELSIGLGVKDANGGQANGSQ